MDIECLPLPLAENGRCLRFDLARGGREGLVDDDSKGGPQTRNIVQPRLTGEIEAVVRLRPIGMAEQEVVSALPLPQDFYGVPLVRERQTASCFRRGSSARGSKADTE